MSNNTKIKLEMTDKHWKELEEILQDHSECVKALVHDVVCYCGYEHGKSLGTAWCITGVTLGIVAGHHVMAKIKKKKEEKDMKKTL